jgi:hypothetical protein
MSRVLLQSGLRAVGTKKHFKVELERQKMGKIFDNNQKRVLPFGLG